MVETVDLVSNRAGIFFHLEWFLSPGANGVLTHYWLFVMVVPLDILLFQHNTGLFFIRYPWDKFKREWYFILKHPIDVCLCCLYRWQVMSPLCFSLNKPCCCCYWLLSPGDEYMFAFFCCCPLCHPLNLYLPLLVLDYWRSWGCWIEDTQCDGFCTISSVSVSSSMSN